MIVYAHYLGGVLRMMNHGVVDKADGYIAHLPRAPGVVCSRESGSECGVCSVCFFFSSRRRHTRCSRDWSSDVCSSDLSGGRLVKNGWSLGASSSATAGSVTISRILPRTNSETVSLLSLLTR